MADRKLVALLDDIEAGVEEVIQDMEKLKLASGDDETTIALAEQVRTLVEEQVNLEARVVTAEEAATSLKRRLATERAKTRAIIKQKTRRLRQEKQRIQESEEALKAMKAQMDAWGREQVARTSEITAEAQQNLLTCRICYDRPRNVVVLPCSHAQYCAVCIAKVLCTSRKCPTCREMITRFIHFKE